MLGPRQVGKTTLAKHYFAAEHKANFRQIHCFDLEKIEDIEALKRTELSLSQLEGLIIIDEIQLRSRTVSNPSCAYR